MAKPPEHPILRHVPNTLTVLRLCAIPVFCVLMIQAEGRTLVVGLLFLIAAFTDWFDGFIARRAGVISQFGKIADPLADRLLVGTAALLLSIYDSRVPWWAFILVIARDALTLIGYAGLRRVVFPDVSLIGKTGTALMMAGLTWLLLLDESQIWPAYPFWAGVVLSTIAYIQYIWRYRWVFRSGVYSPSQAQPADDFQAEEMENSGSPS